MKFRQKVLKSQIVLTLSGELTLPYAAELKDVLAKAIGKRKQVKVTFEDVADADLTLLQLLCSAHRTALGSRKVFTVAGGFPDAVKAILAVGGFSRHRACARNTKNQDCLWIGGEA